MRRSIVAAANPGSMHRATFILLSLLALCLALSCTPAPQPSPTATVVPTPVIVVTATPLSTPQPTFPPAGAGTPTPSSMPQATPSPTGGGTISPTPASPATPTSTPTEEPAPSPAADRTLIPNAPDLDLFDLFRRLGNPWDRPLQPPADRSDISYEKGHRETFWARDSVSKSVYEVEATLSQVSEHAYWYFESGHEPDEEDLAGAVRTFEDNIYPVVTSHFGGERGPGIDNDPRITILHVLNIGPLGYYSAGNEFPVAMYPHSNERTMLYMNLNRLPVGTSGYLGTLTHELQHVLHWGGDPTDEGWVNEGLSEVAKGLAGYGFSYVGFFLTSPATTLTTWPASGSNIANYGGSTLFMEYLAQRYGGHDSLGELVKRPEDGMEGISAYLQSMGYRESFEDVFRDWVVANYLDTLEVGSYVYDGLDVSVSPGRSITGPGSLAVTTPQYAGEYIEVLLPEGDARLTFQGQTETRLLPTDAHSGSHCWWGNRGDAIDSTLTGTFDLSQVSQATLSFRTWYAIEELWDYVYVEVSQDGGETWSILEGMQSSLEKPRGLRFGPGYTGHSGGWLEDSVDLTPYAGQEVAVRFEYVTDKRTFDDGICFDDISIPEIGFFDDAEEDGIWDAAGFFRSDNRVPQGYIIQVIELGDSVGVREMTLDSDGSGSLTLQGSGAGLRKVVVIVAPTAPKTTQWASYVLTVEQVTE